MESLEFLHDLVVVYGLGTLVVYLLQRVGQSPILGFLITGILIGPFGLGFVAETQTVEVLAEIGVMILLFNLGLEFSLKKLMRLRRVVLVTGPVQVGSSIVAVLAVAALSGIPAREGLVLGFVLALSSTAVVLRLLVDSGEIDAIHGRISLGVLIFQDFCVIAMIVVVPLLATPESILSTLLLAVGKALIVVAAVVLVARYLIPPLLRRVVEARSQELFMMASISLLFGIAWVTAEAGFSLALGGFLAGLVLSESEYSLQIFGRVKPFHESLNSLFFISIGMLVDPGFIWANLYPLFLLIGLIVTGKSLIVAGSVLATGFPVQAAILTSLPMAQIGEFSFILLQLALTSGVLPADWHQLMISAAVATMLVTPALRWSARAIVSRTRAGTWGLVQGRNQTRERLEMGTRDLSDHVVICGYGVSGQNVAAVLAANSIPHLILELNAQTVDLERKQGRPLFFGDCTDPEILKHAGIEKARVMLIVISDPFSTRRAVKAAQRLNPSLAILTRTKYVSEIDELRNLGSDEVVAEEFEASLELLWRILRHYHLPRDLIREEIRQIRDEKYGLFRERVQTVPRLRLGRNLDIFVENVSLGGDHPFAGRRLADTPLRSEAGAIVLAIIRDQETISNPKASDVIQGGDTLVLAGRKDQLKRAIALLNAQVPI